MHSICHKYGRQTIPLHHPNTSEEWNTTARLSWKRPKKLAPPHLRIRSIDLDSYYDKEVGSPTITPSSRLYTKASGFV